MDRRNFIRAVAVVPAVEALPLFGQQISTQGQGASGTAPAGTTEAGSLAPPTVPSDNVANLAPKFFTADQFAALHRLSELFMPPADGRPGAAESGSPEFLDFYTSISSPQRQQFYQAGLDNLNAQARSKFKKSFAALAKAEADSILRPMFKQRGILYEYLDLGPFVNRAYQDIRTVTINSPAWAASVEGAGLRLATPLYWRKVDATLGRFRVDDMIWLSLATECFIFCLLE